MKDTDPQVDLEFDDSRGRTVAKHKKGGPQRPESNTQKDIRNENIDLAVRSDKYEYC